MARHKVKGSLTAKVTGLGGAVRKADTQALVTNGTDAFPEDSFVGTYWTGGSSSGVAILEPTYKPGTLFQLVTANNVLSQCVEAMEVNVDGTGHSIEKVGGDTPDDDAEKAILNDFFREPYPGRSMLEIRRAHRRDLESTGNSYLEVIRNAEDEIMMMNNVDAINMRLIRLDDPVPVERLVTRAGKEVKVKVRTRERRFVQLVNGKKVYFKEFGASRDLNRDTGEWATTTRLDIDKRASEILHFTGSKEPLSPYGVPRWINQLPSILGSRKAEEHNLEFFDAGGLPPILVIVQGGTLGTEVKDDLKNHLNGVGGKHRASVVEATSTSGSIDGAGGAVNVRVERFGSERQSDAMFQLYDKACEDHVRCAFRLPPLFIGKASDFSFATAYTAYMVAEAQVFYPERDEFDIVINTNIVKGLGVANYRYRSLPMTLVDVNNQLKALELILTAKIAPGDLIIKAMNEITGLEMTYQEPPPEPAAGAGAGGGLGSSAPTKELAPAPAKEPIFNTKEPVYGVPSGGVPGVSDNTGATNAGLTKSEVVELASRWANVLGLDGDSLFTEEVQVAIRKQVCELGDEDMAALNQILAVKAFKGSARGVSELGELAGCVTPLMAA